jgi:O-acetyl-ADP-ribose deacetylase (regulator of RNase III)
LNKVHLTHRLKNGRTLSVVEDDITDEDVDTVVNAANELLRHSGGIAGAISLRGGPTIDDESRAWVDSHGPVTTGTAAITSGGELKARCRLGCSQNAVN